VSVLDGPGEGTWSVFALKVVEQRDAAREEIVQLRSELEDAEIVLKDALSHANAAAEGLRRERDEARAENARLKNLLTEITVSHLIGQPSDWEGPGGRKEAYQKVADLLGENFEDKTW
jgi:hypothetical protein